MIIKMVHNRYGWMIIYKSETWGQLYQDENDRYQVAATMTMRNQVSGVNEENVIVR